MRISVTKIVFIIAVASASAEESGLRRVPQASNNDEDINLRTQSSGGKATTTTGTNGRARGLRRRKNRGKSGKGGGGAKSGKSGGGAKSGKAGGGGGGLFGSNPYRICGLIELEPCDLNTSLCDDPGSFCGPLGDEEWGCCFL